MKHALALLLLLSLLLLVSCKPGESVGTTDAGQSDSTAPSELSSETDETSAIEETTDAEEETTAPTDDAEEDDDYLSLPARAVVAYERKFFDFAESGMLLHLDLPFDWSVEEQDEGGYRIMRNGSAIGTLTVGGKQGSSDWKLLDTDFSQGNTVLREHYLEKDGIGETLRFRHRYYFRFTEDMKRRIMTMTVDYSELDEDAAMHLFESSGVISKALLDPGFGTLSNAQWGSIAILGNSFISTSKIGGILYDMHTQSGKACYVDAMSRGYAHIDTYVNDSYLMEEIENGKYDAVFICGVNSNHYLGRLKEICEVSDTALVIFPAHNEPQGNIDSAVAAYPEIQLMDWKGEIDALINDGRDKWDFCIDDAHLHSTPLAGYVGAHMIYRAIWGEVPTGESAYGVTQEEIDKVLGEYASTGCVIDVDEEDIYQIKS